MIQESIYNSFHCIAGDCPMTCCKGWAIRVEQEDMNKWMAKQETKYLCQTVSARKAGQAFNMKMDACTACILLDENGLCEIVKKHGEETLSKTCQDFPRKRNEIREISEEGEEGRVLLEEYSLSGACPHVLSLLRDYEKKSVVIPPQYQNNKDFPYEYRIRNKMLELIQDNTYVLQDRCFLTFAFLHECLECEWEEDVDQCIEVYSDSENLREKLENIHAFEVDDMEAFIELSQTYLDMTEFYKEEPMYRPYLRDLSNYCSTIEKKATELLPKWSAFKDAFSKEDAFFEKVIAGEVFSDCISDDMGVILESFQSILMEYSMTRVSLFLRQMVTDISYTPDDLIAYLSLMIRMIGHNVEGMAEYWEENFEDSILEQEYVYSILK